MSKIEKLLQKIRSTTTDLRNWNKANSETIEYYETAFDVKLPDDYKAFLEQSNGLDKIVLTGEAKNLWQQGDYEHARQLENNILDIESVFEEYEGLAIDRWKVDPDYEGPYPYIPFCKAGDDEKLVFGNQLIKKEPAIYYAYHDEPASAWIRVAKNFTEFLDYFIHSKGELPTEEIGQTPNADDIQHVPAELLEKYNKSKEIIKRKTAYLNLFPRDALSYILRANAFSDSGEYQKALDDFQASLEIDQKNAFAYYCRGNMLQKLKKYRQALTDIDTACQLQPDDLYNLSVRAELLYELNKHDKALVDCNRVIDMEGEFLLAYITRRNIYLYLGEAEKAELDNAKIGELLENDE